MIITLSGLPGSGKTTIAKKISEHFGMKWYSIGDLRGKMAQERGLTIDELNKLGTKEDFTDKEVDEYQQKLGKTEDNFVVDGWMSWHFIPHSIKFFVKVDPDEGARRVFDAKRHTIQTDEPEYASIEETKKTLTERIKNSRQRYLKYYNQDYQDESHYDFIIDTSNQNIEEVFEKTVEKITEFLTDKK